MILQQLWFVQLDGDFKDHNSPLYDPSEIRNLKLLSILLNQLAFRSIYVHIRGSVMFLSAE